MDVVSRGLDIFISFRIKMSGKMSPEQVEEFKQAFKLLDVDGDGKITAGVRL